MTPWFWETFQLPAREVEELTLRQAEAYLHRWEIRQRKS